MRTLEEIYGKYTPLKLQAEPQVQVQPAHQQGYNAQQITYTYNQPSQYTREQAEAWDYIFKNRNQQHVKAKESWQNMATNKEYWKLLAEGKTPAQATKIIYAEHKLEKLRKQDSSIAYYNGDFVITYNDLANVGMFSLAILIPLAIHFFIKYRKRRIDLSSIDPSKLK